MKKYIILLFITFFIPILDTKAEDNSFIKSIFGLYENDSVYGNDRYYSNGVQLYFLTDDKYTKEENKFFQNIFGIKNKVSQNYSFGLGQKIYTSSDIKNSNPMLNDRPYAGYLYLFLNKNIQHQNIDDTFGITFGTTGKNSLAEDTQKFIHKLIKSPKPMGWNYQVENKLLLSFGWMRTIDIFNIKYKQNDFNIVLKYITNIGIPLTNFIPSIEFRYGLNTRSDFIPNKIQSLVGNINNKYNSFYTFLEISPNFVFYDYLLKKDVGNLYFDIEKEWFRYDIAFGINAKYNNFYLKWSNIISSKEFKEQDKVQILFSINIGYMF